MSHSKKSDFHYGEETRIALLEQSIDNINETLKRFESRFDKIDEKFDKIDNQIDSNFIWMIGFMIGGFSSILGLLAHSFHWI